MPSSFSAAERRSSCVFERAIPAAFGVEACAKSFSGLPRLVPICFISLTYSAFVIGGELLPPPPATTPIAPSSATIATMRLIAITLPLVSAAAYTRLDGQRTGASLGVRAAAQAAAAADRRHRPGRRRGARGSAREAEHQEGIQALGA